MGRPTGFDSLARYLAPMTRPARTVPSHDPARRGADPTPRLRRMKRVAWGVFGAVVGYAAVSLTLGWLVTNPYLLLLLTLAGTVGGAWWAASSRHEKGA